MARIEKWRYPHYDEMHIVQQPGNGLTELRSCLFILGKHGEVAKILYCSPFKQFFTREKDGWHSQKPGFAQSRHKGWRKSANGATGSAYPQMTNFGYKSCHSLVAFAWCRRPTYITLPDGRHCPCFMDYECGRMYYRDRLLDAQDNFVKDKDGNFVYINVYLQVDHLNSVHDDFNAENLEYVTSHENWRRRSVCVELHKKGFDPKKMPYELLRNFYEDDGMLDNRIQWAKYHCRNMYNLDKNTKQ